MARLPPSIAYDVQLLQEETSAHGFCPRPGGGFSAFNAVSRFSASHWFTAFAGFTAAARRGQPGRRVGVACKRRTGTTAGVYPVHATSCSPYNNIR